MNQFAATVLGAFLAGFFGIIGSLVIWRYQNRKEQKIIIKMLYAELTNLKTLLLKLQSSIDQGIVKPGNVLKFTFLKYNTFTLERQKLYSFIPSDEMNIFESLFSTFEQYDELLKEPIKQGEGVSIDSNMLFWNFYQAQQQDNIKNIDHCLQYLKKKTTSVWHR